jgi:hypothetical protein
MQLPTIVSVDRDRSSEFTVGKSTRNSFLAACAALLVCAAANPSAADITYTDIGAGLAGLNAGAIAWGDYDNDGDLDLLQAGYTGGSNSTRLHRQLSPGSFYTLDIGLPDVSNCALAWGDYDNDGDLDILLAGGNLARLYRNDGVTVFTEVDVGLPAVIFAAADWGDCDNDGDLDILITGSPGGGQQLARVYRNDSGGVFTDLEAGLAGVQEGSVAWGDYDGDGDLDILLTGVEGSSPLFNGVSRVYRNDGDGEFTDIAADIAPVGGSAAAWGDYDADGDLDILLTGLTGEHSLNYPVSRLYRNDGGDAFTEVVTGLPDVSQGSVAWGDHDNDGDLDILLTGYTDTEWIAEIYSNDGAGTFTAIDAGLPEALSGTGIWGDYDNDGDLDVVLMGVEGMDRYTRVYRSDGAPANTPPSAPDGLAVSVSRTDVTLTWNPAVDAETPSAALSYNLRIGTSPGGGQIVSPLAHPGNGYRRVVQLGNAQLRTSWTFDLAPGTYHWSVQAIDGAYAGSPFATERSFEVEDIFFNEVVSNLPGTQLGTLAWGDYDNDGDLDVLVVGDGYLELYIARIYRNDGGGVFTNIDAGMTGVRSAKAAWGDYDNDGDLDVLLAGTTGPENIARIYRNDGGDTFVDIDAGLTGIYDGCVAWGDYDNDGDLDALVSGYTGAARISTVFRNDGAGVFTDAGAGLPGLWHGSAAWGDCDNDGDLDLLLSGDTAVYPGGMMTRVYLSDGSGGLSDAGAGLPGVALSSVAWGDYDSDGDLDILLAGATAPYPDMMPISRVYRNDGAGVFTDVAAELPEVANATTAWADYDNDGDLDFLLGGWVEPFPDHTTVLDVYRNDGADVFTPLNAQLPSFLGGSAAWGDYDEDGDLDLLLTKPSAVVASTSIYSNDGAPANTAPTSPDGLAASLDGDRLTLSWNAASDVETPSAGLTYNVRVGTAPGGCDVWPAMADAANGFRRVVQSGNAQQTTSWTITLAASGDYYWSVQAVDGAYAGSLFSDEQYVAIVPVMLASFTAERRDGGVIVRWAVSHLAERIVLNLWRQEAGRERALLVADVLGRETAHEFVDSRPPTGPCDYWLQGVGTNAGEQWHGPAHVGAVALPARPVLYQNHPNPFNPETTIAFALGRREQIELAVYELTGKLVTVLARGAYAPGTHTVGWNGRDPTGKAMPSGSYLVRLKTESGVETRKVMLVQ